MESPLNISRNKIIQNYIRICFTIHSHEITGESNNNLQLSGRER